MIEYFFKIFKLKNKYLVQFIYKDKTKYQDFTDEVL